MKIRFEIPETNLTVFVIKNPSFNFLRSLSIKNQLGFRYYLFFSGFFTKHLLYRH